ncbi:MAG: MG2 domain-containing protein [Burkholderiales bacterium]|nr:MG2 domain-containing protein [Burkholderiales bacterium]
MPQGFIGTTALLVGTLWAPSSTAATISSVSPQGEVAQVRQITLKFSEAVVPFGDLRSPDPMSVACQGAAPAGAGRWANDRVWLYDFTEPLGPGTRCTLKARSDWKPSTGALTGNTDYSFSTGGPAVVSTQPYGGGQIEEDQYFLLRLNGAAVAATVLANAWCEVEGIGERLPVRVIDGEPRAQLLAARSIGNKGAEAERTLVLACARPLPNGSAVRLIWGKGIGAAANPKIVTRSEQRFRFTVRPAFTAEFSCERERANAPCLPIRPMGLRFSAPISRDAAALVRLKPATGEAFAPVFDKDDKSLEVSDLSFPKRLPENAAFTVELPRDLKDNAGRVLTNAASFPLKVATGDAPPIAKFAAAPFGVIELNAEPVLPVTLRHVQGDLRPAAAGGQVRVRRLQTDADILAWYLRLRQYDDGQRSAREAGLPEKDWYTFEETSNAQGRKLRQRIERYVATRELSLLNKDSAAKRLDLPQLVGGDPRPFEVVGIPLAEPGYHVVEIESARLGESLLDRSAPMFVRTGVLVTNLGVHFKLGRENSVVWVTTLDRALPVAGADVVVNDCAGQKLWSGQTDALGIARVAQGFDTGLENCAGDVGLFVTARKADAKGVVDTSFVFSSWQKGIEAWRFNVPTGRGAEPDARAATVFDRTLFRAGETVSMKHFLRFETSAGLANAKPDELPTRLKIVHEGTGQEFVQPLSWKGARHAVSSWNIPAAARLGAYNVVLERENGNEPRRRREWTSGNFRVEEFRLPLVDARLSGPKAVEVAPKELPIELQLNYFSGGPMAQVAARASAMLKSRSASFNGYDEFSFEPPGSAGGGQLVADKLPLTTDKSGAASFTLKDLPKITRPSEVSAEVTYNDPNGEVLTIASSIPLWPSAVVLGVKAGSWASSRGKVKFTVLALDTQGVALKGQSVDVRGRLSQTITTRKRMVGGFYAYDNRTEEKDLGALCSGSSDDRGLLLCEAELSSAGQVELIANAKDANGNPVQAATSVWVTKQGELWFAQDNDDRIDVLPEKKRYEPGETARLQVRSPFREATALLSVEREGIIESRVVTLRGDDPTIDLKIDKTWGPNVYVSVLALRGRIRDTPWYSFFTWGWKEPLAWARSFWYDGREYQAPTAMVDLAKPAFKLGVAALQVGIRAHELQVSVVADKPQYAVRQKATARIKVQFEGKPVAGAEVAFAAVDEGLLALRGNDSWDLLNTMIRQRAWGVETATAQSEIIGRRHYGRKAVAAGGGGGRGSTRELFDTLLVWKASVVLDANGEAVVEVPLNDSLTSFKLVAIADAGAQQFGTGSTSIRVTQDLQLLSGLPPLVREGDNFSAMLTLRNTTAREMKVRATLQGVANAPAASGGDITRTPLEFAPQDVVLAAGSAKEIGWPISVPADVFSVTWEAAAEEQGGASAPERVRDWLKITQLVSPAVPVRVMQATLQQLEGSFTLPVAAPADALPDTGVKRGGINVAVQPKLSGALPGMRRFFESYPFVCLEQQTSKAVGLKDAALWSVVTNALPTYLDNDGLASYFPPRAEDGPRGSDRLTAYLIAAAHEAGFELPSTARSAMLEGLTVFVEGRIERKFWSPKADLDVRKLAAIEALSRHGRAQAKMLGSINLTPNLWPTAAVIDWLRILKKVDGIPNASKRLEEANQILRGRLTWAGTTLKFSNEEDDFWWWLMDSADANAARLILAVLDDPAWKDDLPRLVVGALGRQRGGAWLTTTANLWGSLALDKFSAKFESVKVAGRTTAALSGTSGAVDWGKSVEGGSIKLAWPAQPAPLTVAQDGTGKPWLTVQSLAAVPLKAPLRAGYSVARSVIAVEQKDKSKWSRGDVLRVRVEVDAQSDMTWVVVSDPVPGGATILGSGLGRDSNIATGGERRSGTSWPAFEERSFEAFRSYYEYLPRGKHVIEYTVRLNNPGKFSLPPTRVEAMYAPETFGEVPNAALEVGP